MDQTHMAAQTVCMDVLCVLQALHVLAELTHLTELELGCASPSRCGRCGGQGPWGLGQRGKESWG